MTINIFGAYRTDTSMSTSMAGFGGVGQFFQIFSYSSLQIDDGADGSVIEGDSFRNERPNDPTQTLNGTAFMWDYTIAVTDGFDVYEIGVMDYDIDGNGRINSSSSEQGYFLGFIGAVPPLNTFLQVLAVTDNGPFLAVDTLVPCFAGGTRIATPSGEVAVEDLTVGQEVVTLDRGAQPIRWIGQRKLGAAELAAAPELRPIRIAAGALGQGLPVRDLCVSPQHRVLLQSEIAQRMFGTDEIFLSAKRLLGLPGITIDEAADEVTYFHLLLDRHEVLWSDGAPTESLFTGPQALKSVGEEAVAEIAALFPEVLSAAYRPVLARREPEKGRRAKRLVARHRKNGKALIGPEFKREVQCA